LQPPDKRAAPRPSVIGLQFHAPEEDQDRQYMRVERPRNAQMPLFFGAKFGRRLLNRRVDRRGQGIGRTGFIVDATLQRPVRRRQRIEGVAHVEIDDSRCCQ